MGTDEHKKLRIKKIQELSGQVGGGCFGQNRFYNPFWLFRAQLGFRIKNPSWSQVWQKQGYTWPCFIELGLRLAKVLLLDEILLLSHE